MHTVSKSAALVLKQLIEAARTNPEQAGYLKLNRGGEAIMPVTVERVGDEGRYELWSVAHYFTQNGDAMRDPEIVFAVPLSTNGQRLWAFVFPVEWTMDNAPTPSYRYTRIVEFEDGKPARYVPRFQKDTATFCTSWMRNVKAQQRLATLGAEAVTV